MAVTVGLVLAALLTACGVSPNHLARSVAARPPSPLGAVAVVSFHVPTGWGSAIPLDDRRLLLSYHQIEPVNDGFVGPRMDEAVINGLTTPFTLVGAEYAFLGPDWALICTDRAVPEIDAEALAPTDFKRPVADGDRVFVLGYAVAGADGEPLPERECISLSCVPATVLRSRATLLYLKTDSPILGGMSGGPTVVWDQDEQEWVVIGVNSSGVRFQDGPYQIRALKVVRPRLP